MTVTLRCSRSSAGLRLPVLAVLRCAGRRAGRRGRGQCAPGAATRAHGRAGGAATHGETDPAAGAARRRVRTGQNRAEPGRTGRNRAERGRTGHPAAGAAG